MPMKEITLISGKGGTGKTSVSAAFAGLAENRVLVDADVDAANLFLVVPHQVLKTEKFLGGRSAEILPELCTGCGECVDRCGFGAISGDFRVDPIACEGCGVCVHFCPVRAISFEVQVCGEKYLSSTDRGPMVHARLGIAQENSGKLVSVLRKEAREIAAREGIPLIITDGPPGIGCPVIASVSNSDGVLMVTEPTLSGMHDLKRVKSLADRMKVPSCLCINKADLNPELAGGMRDWARDSGVAFVGEIPFDPEVIRAMKAGKSLATLESGTAAAAVRKIWERVSDILGKTPERLC
jgi:MinD superfamily P-loop ATPase